MRREDAIIKVCGMTLSENIHEVEALGVDLMGFIFYEKSPRCSRKVPSYLPQKIGRVGVFVDSTLEEIRAKDQDYGFSHIQLHGKESPELCRQIRALGKKVIKALSIETRKDLAAADCYQDCCDYLLFDTKTPKVGGSGNRFDWSILDGYKGNVRFLLSGGIAPESVDEILSFTHPRLAGYDLNSRFESEPGVKDASRLESFIRQLKERL